MLSDDVTASSNADSEFVGLLLTSWIVNSARSDETFVANVMIIKHRFSPLCHPRSIQWRSSGVESLRLKDPGCQQYKRVPLPGLTGLTYRLRCWDQCYQ
jgi:hypothetical protein